MLDTRARILAALRTFVAQRPGLEYGNYGDPSAYRAELRRITKQRHDAESLLDYVERTSITATALRDAFRAFSGRLTCTVTHGKFDVPGEWEECVTIHYCTGQYYPTEYRAAVCAVLTTALWDYWREDYRERTGTTEGARHSIIRTARNAFRSRSIRERFR